MLAVPNFVLTQFTVLLQRLIIARVNVAIRNGDRAYPAIRASIYTSSPDSHLAQERVPEQALDKWTVLKRP